jgi:integrase
MAKKANGGLFKPKVVAYHTPDGKPCRKDTPGAQKAKGRPAKKWYGQWRDADGILHREPLHENKIVAAGMLRDRVRLEADKKAGLTTDKKEVLREQYQRPLSEHVQDYGNDLRRRDNTEKHVRMSCRRVLAILDGCGFTKIQEVTGSKVHEWLADERAAGRLSATTSNYYLRDLKSFWRWLADQDRTDRQPLAKIDKVKDTDEHLERRTLSEEEFPAFMQAALVSKPFRGLTGVDRYMLYYLASFTGFRVSELASLTPRSFDFNADPAIVTVKAKHSKRRKRDKAILPPALTQDMQLYLQAKSDDSPIWPGSWTRKAAKMVKRDLDQAGIAFKDADGKVFDFHAIRHQFISNLAAASVPPKVQQELARHSTPMLTLNRYSHTQTKAKIDALKSLPSPTNGNSLALLLALHPDLSCNPSISVDAMEKNGVHQSERENTGKNVIFQGCDAEAPPGFEPGMADLQSAALPLG